MWCLAVHAGVPDFAAGAMENWGLIIYRDYNILYNPLSSTDVQKQRIVVVIAHELAHMVCIWYVTEPLHEPMNSAPSSTVICLFSSYLI